MYLDLRAELKKLDEKNGTNTIETFLEFLLANYMEDSKLMIWMGEHIFGKPTQPLDVSGGLDITFDEETIRKAKRAIREALDRTNT